MASSDKDMDNINEDKSFVSSVDARPWYNINTYSLPCKASHFTVFFALGAYLPNANVFLTSLGFSKSQAGVVTGIRTVAEMLSYPFWGAIADKTQKHKLILVSITLLCSCFLASQPWIAYAIQPVNSDGFINNDVSQTTLNASNTSHAIQKGIDDSAHSRNDVQNEDDTSGLSNAPSSLFFVLLFMTGMGYFFGGPMPGFLDTRILQMIEASTRPMTYGQQRVGGSVAFGLSAALAGLLADNIQHKGMSTYTAVFYVFVFGIISFTVVVGCFLFKVELARSNLGKKKPKVLRLVLGAIKKPSVLFFYGSVLVTGIASGTLYGFLFIYLEELHASKFLMGLNITFSCAVELLIFPVASKIIKFIRGNEIAMAIGVCSYFPRYLLCSYFDDPWLVFATQVFHGPGFALFWAACVEHTYAISPDEIPTTMISIMYAVYFGVGQLLANVIGGVIYDSLGGKMLFRLVASLCLVWGVLMFAVIIYKNLWKTKQKDESADVMLE